MVDAILRDIGTNVYHAVFMFPPCSSFISPLRGACAPDVYGVPGLTPRDKSKVRLETLLALRCVGVANAVHAKSLEWGIITPRPAAGDPSVFNLPEVAKLDSLDGVETVFLPRCLGGEVRWDPMEVKGPARFISCLKDGQNAADSVPINVLIAKAFVCSHAQRFAADPRSPAESGLSGSRQMDTKAPSPDQHLGVEAPCPGQCGPQHFTSSPISPSRWNRPGSDTPVFFSTPLRGGYNQKRFKAEEDRNSLGGMRDAAEGVAGIPGHLRLGCILRRLLDKFLDSNAVLKQLILSLLIEGMSDQAIREKESALEKMVAGPRRILAQVLGAPSADPVQSADYSTCIRAHILKRWAEVAGDPAAGVCRWLFEGAPAGMDLHPVEAAACFPPSRLAPPSDAGWEPILPEDFFNYQSFEWDEDARREVQGYIDKGYLIDFRILAPCASTSRRNQCCQNSLSLSAIKAVASSAVSYWI